MFRSLQAEFFGDMAALLDDSHVAELASVSLDLSRSWTAPARTHARPTRPDATR